MVDTRRTWRQAERWYVVGALLTLVATVQFVIGLLALRTPPAPFLLAGGTLTAVAAHAASYRSRKLQRRVVMTLYRKDDGS